MLVLQLLFLPWYFSSLLFWNMETLMRLTCAACLPGIHNPCRVRLLQLRDGVPAICQALHHVFTGLLHKILLSEKLQLWTIPSLLVIRCSNSDSSLSLLRTWPSSARCSSSWEWRTPSQGGTPREGPQRLRQPEASKGIVVGGKAINMETRRVLRILLEQYMSRFLPIGSVSWGPAEFDSICRSFKPSCSVLFSGFIAVRFMPWYASPVFCYRRKLLVSIQDQRIRSWLPLISIVSFLIPKCRDVFFLGGGKWRDVLCFNNFLLVIVNKLDK